MSYVSTLLYSYLYTKNCFSYIPEILLGFANVCPIFTVYFNTNYLMWLVRWYWSQSLEIWLLGSPQGLLPLLYILLKRAVRIYRSWLSVLHIILNLAPWVFSGSDVLLFLKDKVALSTSDFGIKGPLFASPVMYSFGWFQTKSCPVYNFHVSRIFGNFVVRFLLTSSMLIEMIIICNHFLYFCVHIVIVVFSRTIRSLGIF